MDSSNCRSDEVEFFVEPTQGSSSHLSLSHASAYTASPATTKPQQQEQQHAPGDYSPFLRWDTPRLTPFPLETQLTPSISPLPLARVLPTPTPTPQAMAPPAARTTRRTSLSTPLPPPSPPRTRRSLHTRDGAGMQPMTPSSAPAAASLVSSFASYAASHAPAPGTSHTGGKRHASIVQRQVAVANPDPVATTGRGRGRKGAAGGAGERDVAASLFPAPGPAPKPLAQPKPKPKPPAPGKGACGGKGDGKKNYMPLDKGRAVFRLLIAAYPAGDWSQSPSDELCASIAQQVGGASVKQIRKKWENVKTRYCSSAGRLNYNSMAVKYALGTVTPPDEVGELSRSATTTTSTFTYT